MAADIKVTYNLIAKDEKTRGPGQISTARFTDWYAFADWLRECEEIKYNVIIHSWEYIHAIRET